MGKLNRKVAIKQLELTRGSLLKFLQTIDESTAIKQPDGFNNNIQWHIGHVLTAAESFMFGRAFKNLPEKYPSLFGKGTKPSEWTADAPAIDVLISQLEQQAERIKAIPEERFEKPLPEPFLGLETVGELYGLMLYHEADHIGQMKAMKRVIEAEK